MRLIYGPTGFNGGTKSAATIFSPMLSPIFTPTLSMWWFRRYTYLWLKGKKHINKIYVGSIA
jgi:hypothetical protein